MGVLSMSLSWWQWHRITDLELSHSSLLVVSLIWPRLQISVLWFFPEFHWFRNQSYRLHTLLHASPCRSGTDIVAPLLINVTAPTIQQDKSGQGTSLLLKTLSSTSKQFLCLHLRSSLCHVHRFGNNCVCDQLQLQSTALFLFTTSRIFYHPYPRMSLQGTRTQDQKTQTRDNNAESRKQTQLSQQVRDFHEL